MKKKLFIILFILLSILFILILRTVFPKNAGFLEFFFFFLLFDLYLFFSVKTSLANWKKSIKNFLLVFYWIPFLLIPLLIGIGMFRPFHEWPVALRTYLVSFLLAIYFSKVFPLLTLVVSDTTRLLKYLVRSLRKNRETGVIQRNRILARSGWIAGGVVFLLFTYGTFFGQYRFRVKEQPIYLRELPSGFNGYRIVQISDLHLGSWVSERKLKEAMDIVNALCPDAIFVTGDLFNFCTADGRDFLKTLGILKAPDGIFVIPGNHDYGDYMKWPSKEAKEMNLKEMTVFYKRLNWKLLRNAHEVIRRANDSILVIGVDNWGARRRFQRNGNVETARKGAEQMDVQLLLSHDPSHWDSIVSKRYPDIDITFSGHSHGGQVGIDVGMVRWSPVKWGNRFWSGLYSNTLKGKIQYLYVNTGLGTIGYSGRLGIWPEITLIKLYNGKDAQ